jgi:hypothetical protein
VALPRLVWFTWRAACGAEQVEIGTALLLPLQQLEPGDVRFGLPVVPSRGERGLAKTAERIQVLEHRALGYDVSAAAVPARDIHASEPPPLPTIDVVQLSPGPLEALQPLLDLVDGRHEESL